MGKYLGFQKLSADIAKESGYDKKSADAAAAVAGRKKYGKKKFQAMAAEGRRRASKKGK